MTVSLQFVPADIDSVSVSVPFPGDLCIIFTPDDTHFAIAEAAIDHGLHVMATKPFVKTLEEHLYLNQKVVTIHCHYVH